MYIFTEHSSSPDNVEMTICLKILSSFVNVRKKAAGRSPTSNTTQIARHKLPSVVYYHEHDPGGCVCVEHARCRLQTTGHLGAVATVPCRLRQPPGSCRGLSRAQWSAPPPVQRQRQGQGLT